MSLINCGQFISNLTFLTRVTFESCRSYQRESLKGEEENIFISEMNQVRETPSQFAWSKVECFLSYGKMTDASLCVSVTEGEVSIQIDVSAKLAPFVQILIFAVLPSETVIAKSTGFDTEKCFSHQVSATGVFSTACSRFRETCFDSLRSQPQSQLNFKFPRSFYFPGIDSSGLKSVSLLYHLNWNVLGKRWWIWLGCTPWNGGLTWCDCCRASSSCCLTWVSSAF